MTDQPHALGADHVSIERLTEAMKRFDIELDILNAEAGVAAANLNGTQIMFVALNSVVIVRGERPTDSPSINADPTYYMAANEANGGTMYATAVIMDKGANLAVRAEVEYSIIAGMHDNQLAETTARAIDNVLATLDRVEVIQKELAA